jgi:hypothetical protein
MMQRNFDKLKKIYLQSGKEEIVLCQSLKKIPVQHYPVFGQTKGLFPYRHGIWGESLIY